MSIENTPEIDTTPSQQGERKHTSSAGRRAGLILLGLLFLCIYGRNLAGFTPAGGDVYNQYLPYQELVRGALRQGVMPYWNAFTFCGRPLMADIQVGVLYPPNWLHWLLPLPLSFALVLALHGAWMIAGCWRLGRRWRLEPAAAALGTVLFCASPFFTLKASQGIVLFIYVGAWWPWMALAATRLLERPGFGRLTLLALALAGSLLAGSPQITFYGWLAICALALALPEDSDCGLRIADCGLKDKSQISDLKSQSDYPQSAIRNPQFFKLKALGWLAGAFALALGLTAIQTAQTASFIGTSFERGGAGAAWEYITDGSLAPRLLWLLANPGFLGIGHSEQAYYFGSQLDFAEACFYAPLWVAMLLVPLGALAWRNCGLRIADCGVKKMRNAECGMRNDNAGVQNEEFAIRNPQSATQNAGETPALHYSAIRNPQSAILHRRLLLLGGVAMALGLALAPGEYSPVFNLFYHVFPGFNRFRVPARLMIFFFSGEALVAAVALHELIGGALSRKGARAAAGAGAAAGLALVWVPFALRGAIWSDLGRTLQGFFIQHGRVMNGAYFDAVSSHAALLGGVVSAGLLLALAVVWKMAGTPGLKWLAWALPALAVLELTALALPFQKSVFFTQYEKTFYPKTELVQTLQREHRGGRILWLDDVNTWLVDQNQPEIYPNRLVMRGLPEARGYDPVNARWIGQWMNLLAGNKIDENPRGFMFVPRIARPAWLTLMGVETVVSYQDLSLVPGLKPVWRRQFTDDRRQPVTLTVWRNERFQGLAFAAPQPKVAPSTMAALMASAGLAANPATSASQAIVVDEAMFAEEAKPLAPAVDARFQVKALAGDANHFRYAVNYPAPALLCLAQSAYGGWSATVDGDPAAIGTLSGTFLAAVVPAGPHEVVFDFLPEGLALGRMISLVALVAMAYGLIRGRMRSRKLNP